MNWENFKCQRCNQCCRQPGFVYLEKGEEEKMAAHLNLTPFDFVNQFCELEDRRRLVLRKHPDESCIFLDENGCQIHEVKPQQCRDFPMKWNTPKSFEYCEGIQELIGKTGD